MTSNRLHAGPSRRRAPAVSLQAAAARARASAVAGATVLAVAAVHSCASGDACAQAPTIPKRVLVAGDSMVGHRAGLSKALSEWFARRGGLVRADAWNGVGIDTYAKSGRIVSLVAANKPDLVFISLGTNDSAVPHPEALRRAIERIVHDIGKRPCVWLAPPVPKRDTGVTDVLRWAVAPCMFLPARGDAYERIADGLHLSNEGGRQWATDIVTALFERPADGGRRGSP